MCVVILCGQCNMITFYFGGALGRHVGAVTGFWLLLGSVGVWWQLNPDFVAKNKTI